MKYLNGEIMNAFHDDKNLKDDFGKDGLTHASDDNKIGNKIKLSLGRVAELSDLI